MHVCPACGRLALEQDRFCARCGNALSDAPSGERRALVTIVFADLVGSTALGELLDAEVLRAVQSRYFGVCADALQAHGGEVEKFIGDASMAVFGIPGAREDDALRACRAALELVDGVDALSGELEREIGVRLRVRVGIHSGEVVAGDPARGQALVTGDAVNTAARLEQAAGAGEVLIGALTRELAGAAVHTEPVAPVAAKGKAQPVPAYKLLAHVRVAGSRDGVLVGRSEHLGTLQDALGRVRELERAETLLVVGEAGIGKSRLVAELLRSLPPVALAATGHCPAYGEQITYWPIREIVDELTGADESALSGLLDGAGPLDGLLRAIGRRPGRVEREAAFDAIVGVLRAIATRGTLVAVIEDLHWAQPDMLDLFEHAAGALAGAPVLLIGTARTDLQRRFGATARVRLSPLDADAASALLAARGTPLGRRAALVKAAAGNPMFLEQLDAAGEAPELLPPTLRALLTARIDRLAPRDREVLDAAAVAGREFWPTGLAALLESGTRDDMPLRLLALEDAELIAPGRADARLDPDLRLSGIFGTVGRYAFRHALIQEAAYASLPKSRAAEQHERFAAALRREPSSADAPVVAWHLKRAASLREALHPRAGSTPAASTSRRAAG